MCKETPKTKSTFVRVEIIRAEINASNSSKGPTSVLFERTPEFIWYWHSKKVTVFSRLITLYIPLAFVLNLARLGQAHFICLFFIFYSNFCCHFLHEVLLTGNRFLIGQIRQLSLFMVKDTKQNNLYYFNIF